MPIYHSVSNVKVRVGAFYQEKVLVRAFSVIVRLHRLVVCSTILDTLSLKTSLTLFDRLLGRHESEGCRQLPPVDRGDVADDELGLVPPAAGQQPPRRLGDVPLVELQTIHRFSQSWRRPLQGPSPG